MAGKNSLFGKISIVIVFIMILIAYSYVTKPAEFFNARPCVSSEMCRKQENPEGVIDPSWRTYFPGGYGGSGINLYAVSESGTPQSDQLTGVDISDAAQGCRQNYADWMRYLEFEAQKKIAGCNSPPDITSLLWG